jgi:hypothetical protein
MLISLLSEESVETQAQHQPRSIVLGEEIRRGNNVLRRRSEGQSLPGDHVAAHNDHAIVLAPPARVVAHSFVTSIWRTIPLLPVVVVDLLYPFIIGLVSVL